LLEVDSAYFEVQTKNMYRREFLELSALGMSSALLASCSGSGTSARQPAKIGFQLYTVRNEIEKDITATLSKVAEVGFAGVETAFWPQHITIKDAAKALKAVGLSVCSAHCELPVGDKKSEMLTIAESFECSKMIWHGWPEDERYKTAEGIKQLAELYNESNLFAKSNGLQFGLHNHWWEFRNAIDGRVAYEVLLDDLEDDVFFELDTYWLKVAGHDPSVVVNKFGRRAPFLHIKDGPATWTETMATDPPPMTAVGKGTQNFPEIVKAADGNTEWMVVEMDNCDCDVFTAIKESYTYLSTNGLGTGRA
jgi:sugar phosphate isomerase/epimerase